MTRSSGESSSPSRRRDMVITIPPVVEDDRVPHLDGTPVSPVQELPGPLFRRSLEAAELLGDNDTLPKARTEMPTRPTASRHYSNPVSPLSPSRDNVMSPVSPETNTAARPDFRRGDDAPTHPQPALSTAAFDVAIMRSNLNSSIRTKNRRNPNKRKHVMSFMQYEQENAHSRDSLAISSPSQSPYASTHLSSPRIRLGIARMQSMQSVGGAQKISMAV